MPRSRPFSGRSRTCPMLALTTYPGPRNLLMDLAFFGLSTITSACPPRTPSERGTSSVWDLRARLALGAAGFLAVFVSGGVRAGGDFADLRSAVYSDPRP